MVFGSFPRKPKDERRVVVDKRIEIRHVIIGEALDIRPLERREHTAGTIEAQLNRALDRDLDDPVVQDVGVSYLRPVLKLRA